MLCEQAHSVQVEGRLKDVRNLSTSMSIDHHVGEVKSIKVWFTLSVMEQSEYAL